MMRPLERLQLRSNLQQLYKSNDLIMRFMLINVCTGTWVGMVNFIIPVFALSLGASSFEIGLVRGLSGVGDLLLVLPAGLLIDYFGSRKMYLASCAVGGAITILLALAWTPWALIVMMIFYGMARSIRTTSLNASFFQHMNTIGAGKGGWYKGSMTVGAQFLGSLIGGALAVAVSFAGYFVTASMFLLAPILVALGGKSELMIPASRKKRGLKGSVDGYRHLLRDRILVSATITECINTAFAITFSTFVAVMVITSLGLSIAMAALLISLRGLANIVVVFFGGRLLELNHYRLYVASFIFSAAGLLLLGTSKDVWLLMLASVILGLFSGVMTLVTFTQVGSTEGEKGKVSGIFSFGQKAGMVAGPVLGGIVGSFTGLQAIFLCFIPFFLLMAAYNLLEGRNTRNISGAA
ncbi:MFS transporter [Methanocella arvoryzae]|nr:MFS transporter [Methanocella arvoryzae]